MAKKKTVGRRRPARIPLSRGGAAGALKKPRIGASRPPGLASRADPAEQDRIAKIFEERQAIAEIVVSVMRGVRQDNDARQERMGFALGRSTGAISNMEQLRTDWALPDSILWVRELKKDPRYLDEVFERLLFQIKKFYAQRDSPPSSHGDSGTR